MRENMIHDYHGERERSTGIMVCTKVKGHTQNIFSWSPLPCESLAQESTPNPITLASSHATKNISCEVSTELQGSRGGGGGEGRA